MYQYCSATFAENPSDDNSKKTVKELLVSLKKTYVTDVVLFFLLER